jgi:hypothetical protein
VVQQFWFELESGEYDPYPDFEERVVHYAPKIVEQLLFNYADVQESLLGVLIDMRCDIEVALLKLTGPEQELAYSVMSQGEGALLSGAALEPGEWHSVVHKLAYILNVEGTG